MGLTPQRAAKDASVFSRSGLSPMVIRRVTALSGPMPTGTSSWGAWRSTSRVRRWFSSSICPVSCSTRSASMRNVMWVAWATASSSPPPSGGLRDAQVRNNSALPKLDNRSRSAGSAMTRTAFELVDRLGTGLDRGVLGELEDPGAVHRSIAGLGPGPGATAEHGPRGGLCVDRVRLPHQTAGRAVGPVHFISLDLLRQQVAGQTRAEGAGALHPGTAHRTPLAGPDKQLSVACRRRGKGLCSQDLPQRGDHGGDMHLAVRVHTPYGLATSGRIRARGGTALSGRHGGPPPAW